MMCEDCGTPTKVVKTMVLDAITQRLRECDCGTRFLTTETVTRRLASTPTPASIQPPGNGSLSQPTPSQPPGNRSAHSSVSDQISLPSADQTQTRTRVEPVFVFDVVANAGNPWELHKAKHDEYVKAFPSVDVVAEYRKMAAWLSSNPVNRKTPRGMPSFLFRWLAKAQDRGGSSPRLPVSAVPPWKQAERDAEERKRREQNDEAKVRREIEAELAAAARSVR